MDLLALQSIATFLTAVAALAASLSARDQLRLARRQTSSLAESVNGQREAIDLQRDALEVQKRELENVARAVAIQQDVASSDSTVAEARFAADIMDQFASDEMLESLKTLRRWRQQYGDQFAFRFAQVRYEPEGAAVDQSRRRVSHFFGKTARLLDYGLLRKEVATAFFSEYHVDLFREFLIPLETALALHAGWEPKFASFQQIADLFSQDLSPSIAEARNTILAQFGDKRGERYT